VATGQILLGERGLRKVPASLRKMFDSTAEYTSSVADHRAQRAFTAANGDEARPALARKTRPRQHSPPGIFFPGEAKLEPSEGATEDAESSLNAASLP